MDFLNGITVKLLPLVILVALLMMNECVAGLGRAGDGEIMCMEEERQALLKFKQGIRDDYGFLASWEGEENKECCRWKGITCSNTTHRVIALQLAPHAWYSLHGNFSDLLLHLQHLKELQHLNLRSCTFSGQIPGFIGSFKELRHLNLRSCNFSGVVPSELGNLTKLKTLDLGLNNGVHANSLEWLYQLSLLSGLDLSETIVSDTNWLQVISSLPLLKELYLSNLPQLTPSSMSFSVNTSFPSLARVALKDIYQVHWSALSWLLNMSASLVSIDLSNNQLGGSIPKEFENFVHLESLSLSRNALEGCTPSSLTNLSNLKYLDLSYNQITEFLPNLKSLFSLRELYLSHNKLKGLPHTKFWQHENLQVLDISYNVLEGNISESYLSNLPNLKELSLSFNSLTLNLISPAWVPPFQLDVLELSHCHMRPRFPKWIQTQNSISHLDLSSGVILDSVPEWLWDLSPRLTFLNLSHNQLSGSVPDLSSKFFGFPQVDVSFNNFSGFLPLFNPNSTLLQLSGNMFSGPISSIFAYDKVGLLDLSNNQLFGEFPRCWMNMTYLAILDLSNNNISGEIGSSLVSFPLYLRALLIRNNNLSGELPPILKQQAGVLEGVVVFDVGGNKITGNIPTWLGTHFPTLRVLSLRDNRFHGMIPLELCSLTHIQVLDLSKNNISGELLRCFNNFPFVDPKRIDRNSLLFFTVHFSSGLTYSMESYIENVFVNWKRKETKFQKVQYLTLIDLSNNRFVGNIPKEFSLLRGLASLNLSWNQLTGSIDSNIGQMEFLECLDLSNNQLSGEIPIGLAKLSFLSVLDLSNNSLSGRIPTGTQLQTFNASTYAGNDGLCGLPLALCPIAADPPNPLSKNGNHNYFDQGFYIFTASGFVVGFWGAILVSICQSPWSNACISFWKSIWDWIYVMTVIYVRRLRRKDGTQ